MGNRTSSALEKYKRLEATLEEVERESGLRLERERGNYSLKFQSPPDEQVITLSSEDIATVLRKYLDGKLQEIEVEQWANLIIMHDSYEVAPDEPECQRDILLNILHKLATPEINAAIDETIAKYYLNCILSEKMPTS